MTLRVVMVSWMVLAVWGTCPAAELKGTLRWHRAERRVDADLEGGDLRATLEQIAAATGWEVLMEPGLEGRVSARFEGRPEREALATLLADVNFALLPAGSGPTRLLVFRSSTSRATVPVRATAVPEEHAAEAESIANELVVRLKPGSKLTVAELARRLGARVAGSIDSLNAHRLVFEDAEAAAAARTALESESEVASVESNYPLGTPGRIEPLPGAMVPPLSLRARPMNDANSVIVALLDTRLPAAGVAHTEFLLPGLSIAAPGAAGAGNGPSHGAAMFETIVQGLSMSQSGQTGPPVRVLPVDIYGGQAQTSTFELAQGIVASLERGADILNLSLSGPSPSPLVHDVLQQAAAAGTLTFVAPGNQPTTAPTYPAAYPEVVAVTASDRAGQVASYANRGGFVDLIAPGTSVVPYGDGSWVVHGTSVSTAYAAGIAAGLLADSGRPASEIVGVMQTKMGFQPPPAATSSPTP